MSKPRTHTRGMLFTKHMVQAIIDGNKNQTRRPLKSKIAFPDFLEPQFIEYHLARCPYGRPGDWLYARETTWKHIPSGLIYYDQPSKKHAYTTTPSLLMPFDRARVFVQIEDLRIERLNDITEEDAINEGIEQTKPGIWKDYNPHYPSFWIDPRKSYFSLWDSINSKKYPSKYNPFVWRVKFGSFIGIEEYLEKTGNNVSRRQIQTLFEPGRVV
jgi:hypothetical protein